MKFVSILCIIGYASAFAAIAKPRNAKTSLVRVHESAAAATPVESKFKGEAGMASTTFNIAKSIIGAGVLSLPSGVAFFADQPAALIPASLLTAVMGLVAAYSYSLIGKACEQHNANSFQEVWEKSVGPKTAGLISGGITAQCFLASLAYCIIIGDSFTSIASSFNLPAQLAKRNNIIVAFAAIVLYPLCSLKSLNALAPFSILGLGGTLYTAIFMAIRYFDKSYTASGAFFKGLATNLKPSFNQRGPYSINHLSFVLISMLSTAFIAHFNAPNFYAELKDTNTKRFNTVVNLAFGASIIVYIFMMSIGFLTFGGNSSGFVLNNYASNDILASFARLAVGLALVTGFPFTFSAMRDGMMDLMKWKDTDRVKYRQLLTQGLFAVLVALALVLKDVGFVVSISGAMFGSAIMFIVPAVMNLSNARKPTINAQGVTLGRIGKFEKIFNHFMMGGGILMGVLGVVISTLRQIGKL